MRIDAATFDERGDDVVVDGPLDQQPAARDAGLARADEPAEGRAACGDVDRGVVEDEDRRLAAEFEGRLGEPFRGRDRDGPAGFGTAGEDGLLDEWVFGERGARPSVPGLGRR